MAIEIERRFLVRDPQAVLSGAEINYGYRFRQGYLGWIDGLRMRVRIITGNDQHTAVLTLKGRRHGICREEYEHPLELDCAEQILSVLPPTRIICKTRHRICYRDGLVWSIDRFEGPNTGLVIAEIELADPEQYIELPPWAGEEITFSPRYGNSALARSPIRHFARQYAGPAPRRAIANGGSSPVEVARSQSGGQKCWAGS